MQSIVCVFKTINISERYVINIIVIIAEIFCMFVNPLNFFIKKIMVHHTNKVKQLH